ncbi:polysaccharide deacetylase family protein [Salinimicrobium catena]|uniref:polysaccharide deacetylase family protein n=1 Tax=Salinimicrobium catena TaxID=390640 RepID=UPI002FE49F26
MKVLVYHKIHDKTQFEKQIKFLKRSYNIIDPTCLEDHLCHGKSLPENSLMITFDDGDSTLYKNAFPVLKRENIPAIIFVITNLIGTNEPFWWDELEYLLGEEEGNNKVWEVKTWPNKKRVQYLQELRSKSNKEQYKYPQLSIQELKEMQHANILIANHTHTHPMLDKCEEDELEEELFNSTEKLKERKFNYQYFAYPNGNYSERAEKKLVQHGIKYSFLFDHKINTGKLNPLRISRLKVNDNTPIWKLKFILSGWHSRVLPVTRTLGKLRR